MSWLCGLLASGALVVATTGNAREEPWVADAATRRKEFIRLPSKSERALEDGARWLLAHQDEDGRWSCERFAARCKGKESCAGPGRPQHDVGVTGLAVLALLAAGELSEDSPVRAAVERALAWLVSQQDAESGLVGEKIGHAYLYGHAIATTALAEGRILLGDAALDEPLSRAVTCVCTARNPRGVWRYDLPPNGDNDTSVTCWMFVALVTAREAGTGFASEITGDVVAWVDHVTEREAGRVGYDSPGSSSSRIPGVNAQYPTDCAEAMTSAGLLLRFLCGQDPADETYMEKHAELIAKKPAAWGQGGRTADLYAWYHATSALHQLGGSHWRAWSKELVSVLTGAQVRRGEEKGSWPPEGPWGFAGGRVYSTALAMLTLAAPVRHRQLVGG